MTYSNLPSAGMRAAATVVILVSILYPGGLRDIELTPAPQIITRHFFGMHIHRAAEGTAWPSVPFGSWRLWDAHVTWADIEPGPHTWNWTRLDAYVAMAQAHDVEILLTLGMTPQWASSQPNRQADPPLGYPRGAQSPPARLEDWTEYVRTVALRYKGRIRYYEIWNEPNQSTFFSGNPQQMAELSKAAYGALKAIDSANVVVSPSPNCDDAGQLWLTSFLAGGGATYADVIGGHFYVMPHGPEAMVEEIEQVQSLLHRFHVHKPLWNTEAGWGPPSRFASEHEEAAFVVRTLLLNAAAGVERVYWYAWDNTNWVRLKLADPSTGAIRCAGLAYAELYHRLVGARVDECRARGSTWSCRIATPDEQPWQIVWSEDKTILRKTGAGTQYLSCFDCSNGPPGRQAKVAIGGCPVVLKPSPQ